MGQHYKLRGNAESIFYSSMKRAGVHCPKWARTGTMRQQFIDIYVLARKQSKIWKTSFHVDHITPLHGKSVSGLHVPWNLKVVSKEINLAKGTLVIDDWLPKVEEMPVDPDRLPWGGLF